MVLPGMGLAGVVGGGVMDDRLCPICKSVMVRREVWPGSPLFWLCDRCHLCLP